MSRLEDLFYKLKEFNLSNTLTIDDVSLFIPKGYKGTDVIEAFETGDEDVLKSTYDYIFRLELVAFTYKGKFEENDIFDVFYFVPAPYRDIVELSIKIATFDTIGYTKNDDDVWNSIRRCCFYKLEILEKVIYQLEKRLPKCCGKQKMPSYEADVSLLNSLSHYCGIIPNFQVPKIEETTPELYNNFIIPIDENGVLENGNPTIIPLNEEETNVLKEFIAYRDKNKKEEQDIPFEKNNTESQKKFILTIQGFFFEDNEYLTHKFRDAILDTKIFISEEMLEDGGLKLNVDLTSFLLEDLFYNIDALDIAKQISVSISNTATKCLEAYIDNNEYTIESLIMCINTHRFSIVSDGLWKFISANFIDKEFLTEKKLSHSAIFNESPRMMNVEEMLEKIPHKLAYGIGELG